ncbi:hypothetical protein [Acidomonas methanolica]|uniref:Uncharacterized protein n=1 Tax=Acidomonas methanolica NBRC 104435 TaxID=1231351 RepID=A0A023D4W1_ACIMT|nr:hypothetical protein [Acidomonas methanolica]MBU2654879.1 hypothetical protein [Acidomonas methanolica]TCS24782.1 hypothetical protein EDC31_12134 [Acidomonas methanolica]GAJ29173.1 hypothetical protein Amme_050_016 [Acidomonas methanolica NBRC 104435]GBQ49866.1 hypothetical protein AA0498_1088 [Acidomonas methanolica]GEK99859.1 hypothetical protein AME01nite_23580 [Acidomonas methanolica NBRC 104435]
MSGYSVDMGVTASQFPEDALKLRRATFGARSARIFATCAQGAWVLLAMTPVIVVLCALKG